MVKMSSRYSCFSDYPDPFYMGSNHQKLEKVRLSQATSLGRDQQPTLILSAQVKILPVKKT